MSNEMLKDSPQFYASLSEVLSLINQSSSFTDAFPLVEHALLRLFKAERVTVYQRNLESSDIFSRFKSGPDITETRVPVGTTSIAGYVAFSRKPLVIRDVNDREELRSIHPNLMFNDRFSDEAAFECRAMLVVPIKYEQVLLGVLQVMNRVDKERFDQQDLLKAEAFAHRLGQKFRADFGCTHSPFEYLVKEQLIEPQQLRHYQKQAGTAVPLTRLLRNEMKLTTAQIGRSLESYYQVPFVAYEPSRYQLHPVCKDIKPSYLKSNNLVLLGDGKDDDRVLMLIDDPNDTSRVLAMEHLLGTQKVLICVGLLDDIHQYLGLASLGFDVANDHNSDVELVLSANALLGDATQALENDGSDVVQLVNQLLFDAKRWNASDVHIEPGKENEPTRVRMRVDGGCQESIQVPSNHTRAIISRIKVMAHMDISDRRLPQDGKFSVRIKGQLLDFRVATVPTVNGEAMVLRLLQSGEPIPFSQLNLSIRNETEIKKLLAKPHGLLLVVGPTGSGKTTTLHALLSKLNTPDRKIWTAEDPVEITQSGLLQVQVQPKIGLDFATALRAFLRADPDVILIGEMRDRETAKAAVDAALTGHLVLSTLHTNSAAETITRLLGLDIDPDNFSEALVGVVAQRLVRTLCIECKQPYRPEQSEVDMLVRRSGNPALSLSTASTLYQPGGCAVCNNTGYRGRTAIHELLVSGDKIRDLINHDADAGQIARQAIEEGMQTLLQDGINKILAGDIDYPQLKRVAAE